MIVNKYSNGGGGGGGTDVNTVKRIVDSAITEFSGELQEGNPIVGMAEQLYSPDGITSEGAFTYRTTAGDADVSSAPAELRKIEGNSIYPELQYNDSAVLEREGEPVTGFTYDIEWGDLTEWISLNSNESVPNPTYQIRIPNPSASTSITIYYRNYNNISVADIVNWNVDTQEWSFTASGSHFGTFLNDGTYLVCTLGTDAYGRSNNTFIKVDGLGYQYTTGTIVIPNDIPVGETTYTYSSSDSAWTSTLPQALQNMKVDGSDYVPQDGDEITITRSLYKEGRAQFSTPRSFVSLGLNSFNKDSATTISDFTEDNGVYTVYVYAVAGLEKGYVVYSQNSGITAAGIGSGKTDTMDSATTTYGESLSIVYPTTAKPYIIVTTTDIDGLCIHPRWSGYNDEVYEPYEESKIDGLLNLIASYGALWSVGNVRNTIDIENGQYIRNISNEDYSAARVSELLASGLTIGTDFDFDDTFIYTVLDTPIVSPITFDGSYHANDFSVEYFVDANGIIPTPLYAETYYMNNLVDKLRRMESDYIILNSLDGEGEEGQLYSYKNRLYRWVNGAGRWGKWIIAMDGNAYNNISTLGGNTSIFSEYSYLIYTYLPFTSTTLLCSFQIVTTNRHLGYFPEDNKLKVFDNTGLTGTSIAEISMDGEEADITTSNRHMYISWVDNRIIFRSGDAFVKMAGNYVDTSVSVPHYEALDVDYFDGTANINKTAGAGFPVWNSEGKVVGGILPNVKSIYVNTTGYTKYFRIINTGNNNLSDRWFFPTQGGTAGQVLTSAGNNDEPTWETLIKGVKITSDAYEALATKDPNTLYLIVNE